MATPPKPTTHAGSSPSDNTGATGTAKTAAPKAGADTQKVDFDMDSEVKKQLDAGGSYKPPAEKIAAEYFPPGPHPIGAEGVGGASGGVNMSTDDVAATAPKPAETEKK